MKGSIHKGKAFYSLFFSFLLVVILPLTLLAGMFSLVLDRAVQQEYLQNYRQLLESVGREIDGSVSSCIKTASHLSNCQALKRLMAGLDETDEQTIEAMREISSYTSLMGSSEDICAMTAIYLPEREIIVSNSTYSTKPKEFYQIFLDFEDTTAEEFYDMVSDPQLFFFSYGCKSNSLRLGSKRYLCHTQPIILGYRNKHAYYISLYDIALLEEFLLNNLPAGSRYQLLTPDSSLLLSSEGWTPPALAKEQLKNTGEWKSVVDGKEYLTFSLFNDQTGLQYVFYLSRSRVFEQLRKFQYLQIGLCLILLFIGVFFAKILARQHYAPLRHLLVQAYPGGIPERCGEYQLLSQKFEETQQQNLQFRQEIQEQSLRIRNDMLLQLLTGYSSVYDEELQKFLQESNLHYLQGRFHVLVVRDCPSEDLSGEGVEVCALSPDENVLILNDNPPAEELLSPLQQKMERLHTRYPDMQIGWSQGGQTLSCLKQCFRTASDAISSRVSENGRFFGNSPEKPIYYPLEKEVQLISALNIGDYETCKSVLIELRAINLQRCLPPEMMLCLLHNMIATGCRAYETMQIKEKEPLEIGLRALDPVLSEDQLFEHILKMYRTLCELNLQNQKDKNQRVMTQVVEYIQTHHCEPDLSLETISVAFQVSYYYLSRIFREEAGQSFSELLNQCRILHATELLANTAMSAQDISTAVGYSNVNSFFRVFRKNIGTTPQQYRKLRREDADASGKKYKHTLLTGKAALYENQK